MQLFHHLNGLISAADPGERVGEPEGAAEERALAAAESVVAAVAGEQRAGPKTESQGVHRGRESSGVGALVAQDYPQQQTGVEFMSAGLTCVAADAVRPTARFDRSRRWRAAYAPG